MGSEPPADLFAPLTGYKHLKLTTFKKGGVPVDTPVWFAEVNGKLYVRTDRGTGKVRRIRQDPIVMVAPCVADGTPLGPAIPGKARILPREEEALAARALRRKYWLQRGVLGVLRRLLGRAEQDVYLEISPV